MPVGRGGRGHGGRKKKFCPSISTASTHGHLVFSPAPFASRDQDGGTSYSTIEIYDLTDKQGTVNSLPNCKPRMYACRTYFRIYPISQFLRKRSGFLIFIKKRNPNLNTQTDSDFKLFVYNNIPSSIVFLVFKHFLIIYFLT